MDGRRGLCTRDGSSEVKGLTLKDIAKNIRESQYKRVVVMAGAGISTPSGIPDFRYMSFYWFMFYICSKY